MNPNDKKWKEKKLNHYDNKILIDDNESEIRAITGYDGNLYIGGFYKNVGDEKEYV